MIILSILLLLPIVSAERVDSIDSIDIPVRLSPVEIGLSPDSALLYMRDKNNRLEVINLENGNIESSEFNKEVLPPGLLTDDTYKGYIFIPSPLGNTVSINCQRNGDTLKRFISGSAPTSVVINEEANKVFVSNSKDKTISEFKLSDILSKKEEKQCRTSYMMYIIILLIASAVSLLVFVILTVNKISIVKEERKLMHFVIEHLEKGHELGDIKAHMKKHLPHHKVEKAAHHAMIHIHKKHLANLSKEKHNE